MRETSDKFLSCQDAIENIKSANFKIEDDENTSKSSWIKSASFYSCDGNNGYFILITKDKDYLYSECLIQFGKNLKMQAHLENFTTKE